MNFPRAAFLVSFLSAAAAIGAGCSSSSSGGSAGETDGGGLDGTTPGSSSGGSSSGSSGSSSGTSTSGSSSSGGSSGGSSGTSDGGADAGCVELTVKDYKDWCSLSVNGQAVPNSGPPTTGSSTLCVPPGTVTLVASPYSTHFELGPHPWHGTSGDVDGGDPGVYVDAGTGDAEVNSTNTATVIVTGGSADCVWACCPFTNGTGCDPATIGNPCVLSDGGAAEAGPDASGDASADSGTDAGGDAGCVSLTVKNYLTWCTLTANGQPVANNNSPGTTSVSTVCVPPGSINLVASPLSTTFELGPDPWHDTSGDHGSGDPGTQANVDAGVAATSTTTVGVATGGACVWACCPFADGTGCTSVNQCP